MCDITDQFNRPFIHENNIILFYDDNIIEKTKIILGDLKTYSLKISRYFISICEGMYDSLEYSEAKTITGLIVVLYFISLLIIHLIYSLTKKNNRIRILEQQLQYIRNN